jgi:hypothetical protein
MRHLIISTLSFQQFIALCTPTPHKREDGFISRSSIPMLRRVITSSRFLCPRLYLGTTAHPKNRHGEVRKNVVGALSMEVWVLRELSSSLITNT